MCLCVLCVFPCPSVTPTPGDPSSPASQRGTGHSQQLLVHLAALGEASLQQRPHHWLHGALQRSRHHQRLAGLLRHKVGDPVHRNTLQNTFRPRSPGSAFTLIQASPGSAFTLIEVSPRSSFTFDKDSQKTQDSLVRSLSRLCIALPSTHLLQDLRPCT